MSPRSPGFTTVAILQAIEDGRRYGVDIMEATGLGGGTVYKVLHRLEERALVKGAWEAADVAEKERRPRRRYYELTKEGQATLAEALARWRSLTRGVEGARGALPGEG